jgi:AraC-like DNA-binding protein
MAQALARAGGDPGEMLSAHRVISTRDLDQARRLVADVFCPHRLELSSSGRLDLRHNVVKLQDVALNYMDYGAEVRIVPGVLESFYLVQIPLRGGSEVRSGDATVQSDSRVASVPSAAEPLEMVWRDDSPHFVVYVSRRAVERRLADLTGREAPVPLRFRLGMDLTDPAVRGWSALVDVLRRDAEDSRVSLHPTVRRQMEEAVVTGLITAQPHNLVGWMERSEPPAAPKAVRLAMERCEATDGTGPTVADLAAHAGVSIRALQEAFRRYVGMTPNEYLRDVRLRRVREELRVARPGDRTVAAVAYSWGFNHLGRFAAMYVERFGELPSDTLRG